MVMGYTQAIAVKRSAFKLYSGSSGPEADVPSPHQPRPFEQLNRFSRPSEKGGLWHPMQWGSMVLDYDSSKYNPELRENTSFR